MLFFKFLPTVPLPIDMVADGRVKLPIRVAQNDGLDRRASEEGALVETQQSTAVTQCTFGEYEQSWWMAIIAWLLHLPAVAIIVVCASLDFSFNVNPFVSRIEQVLVLLGPAAHHRNLLQ